MTDAFEAHTCAPCAFGWHWECYAPRLGDDGQLNGWCCCGGIDWAEPLASLEAGNEERSKKLADMRDTKSTGRKRAAIIMQVVPDQICAWAGLAQAGGGVEPIVGCEYNIIEPDTKGGEGADLHHGPNKNTMDNRPDVNLHAICKSCHHAWHARNDKYYAGERPEDATPWLPDQDYLPHNPYMRATEGELRMSNVGRKSVNEKASQERQNDLWRARQKAQRVARGLAGDPELL